MRRERWTHGVLRGAGGVAACALLGGIANFVGGCTAARVTDPERTATEQFLLSQSAVEAVSKLTFDPLRGRRVWIDTQYFAAADAPFVLGQLRAKMLVDGVRLMEEREAAQVVVEVRSGGVGIDREGFLIGIPPVVGYELSIFRNLQQHGIAEVAYVAYWRETGEVVAASGPFIGRSVRDDWWYVGVGPWSRGDIPPVRDESEATDEALRDVAYGIDPEADADAEAPENQDPPDADVPDPEAPDPEKTRSPFPDDPPR